MAYSTLFSKTKRLFENLGISRSIDSIWVKIEAELTELRAVKVAWEIAKKSKNGPVEAPVKLSILSTIFSQFSDDILRKG